MSLIKKVFDTAKEIYEADKNEELSDYFSNKISSFVDGLNSEEREEEEREKIKSELEESIKNEYNSDDFDNDYFQEMLDEYLEYAEYAEEAVWAYYYKTLGWRYMSDSYGSIYAYPEEEQEKVGPIIEDIKNKWEENIDNAIECLRDNTYEEWICTLLCLKSELLKVNDDYMNSSRLAIKALKYACDKSEYDWAMGLVVREMESWTTGEKFLEMYGIDSRDAGTVLKSNAIDLNSKDVRDNMDSKMNNLSFTINELKHGFDRFHAQPYYERQFIFTVKDLKHIAGCYDEADNINYVFPVDLIPKDISFPLGHPLPNTLYYAHPLRPLYLPFEQAELSLFYEKVHEICRLFQCLGATKITTRVIKGNKISESLMNNRNFDASIDYKVFSGNGSFSGKSYSNNDTANRNEMFLTQTFSPQKYPYCPDDLLWVNNDAELQNLVKQRLEGGMLNFTKRVSSSETSNLSQNKINEIKVSFKSLILNVNSNYSASSDKTFSSTNETEWELNVEFLPIEKFSGKARKFIPSDSDLILPMNLCGPVKNLGIVFGGNLRNNISVGDKVLVGEKSVFKEFEVKGLLKSFKNVSDAKSGDKVAVVLDGIGYDDFEITMGIYLYKNVENRLVTTSNEQQKVTSVSSSKKLSSDEERYREEVMFCLEEGQITDSDRVYLERKRVKLGISKEKAKEIESSCQPQLTESEEEYFETYLELTEKGPLTDRVRKLLEREREMLGISKERARQIENM